MITTMSVICGFGVVIAQIAFVILLICIVCTGIGVAVVIGVDQTIIIGIILCIGFARLVVVVVVVVTI